MVTKSVQHHFGDSRWPTCSNFGGPGTAEQPYAFAYVINGTLTTLRYFGYLRCGESPPTAYYVENDFTLPGSKISGHFVTGRDVVDTRVGTLKSEQHSGPNEGRTVRKGRSGKVMFFFNCNYTGTYSLFSILFVWFHTIRHGNTCSNMGLTRFSGKNIM